MIAGPSSHGWVLTTPISAGRMAWWCVRNPGVFWSPLRTVFWHRWYMRWTTKVICWVFYSQVRKNWLVIWISMEVLAAVTMWWWEFKILRESMKASSRIKQILACSGICLAGSHQRLPWRAKETRKVDWSSRTSSSKCKNGSILAYWNLSRYSRRPVWLNRALLIDPKCKIARLQKVEVGTSYPGGLQRHCSNVRGRNWESKSSAGIQIGKGPEKSQELL